MIHIYTILTLLIILSLVTVLCTLILSRITKSVKVAAKKCFIVSFIMFVGGMTIYPLSAGLGTAHAYTGIPYSNTIFIFIVLSLMLLVVAILFDYKHAYYCPYIKLALIMLSLTLAICTFSSIYMKYGIIDNNAPDITNQANMEQSLVKDFNTCLYFSIVTFTTLGYGDFRPPFFLRHIAAYEAMFGYLYMASIAAVIISFFQKQT